MLSNLAQRLNSFIKSLYVSHRLDSVLKSFKSLKLMIHFFLSGGGMKVVYPHPHQFQVNGCEEAVKMYISM